MIEQLIEVCRTYVLPQAASAVLREPYIPYLPDPWNGTLVLAEAQNLSSSSADYVQLLKAMTPDERLQRLQPDERGLLGIMPWDDGSLKLAVEAAWDLRAAETAVSNAILWSQVDGSGNNQTPSAELVALSMEIWGQLLPIIQPKQVITVGVMARTVIEAAAGDEAWRHTALRHPSPNAMSRVSGMFETDDLLARYPEVKRVATAHAEWLETYTRNKVFFACHAVSLVGCQTNEAT